MVNQFARISSVCFLQLQVKKHIIVFLGEHGKNSQNLSEKESNSWDGCVDWKTAQINAFWNINDRDNFDWETAKETFTSRAVEETQKAEARN